MSACRIVKSPKTGEMVKSQLWDSLYNITGDEAKADKLYANTQSESFKQWFKDSKVVDENGEPLLLYSGSSEKFDTFSKNYFFKGEGAMVYGAGFYFTNDPETAEGYSNIGAKPTKLNRRIERLKSKIHFLKSEVNSAHQHIRDVEQLEKLSRDVDYLRTNVVGGKKHFFLNDLFLPDKSKYTEAEIDKIMSFMRFEEYLHEDAQLHGSPESIEEMENEIDELTILLSTLQLTKEDKNLPDTTAFVFETFLSLQNPIIWEREADSEFIESINKYLADNNIRKHRSFNSKSYTMRAIKSALALNLGYSRKTKTWNYDQIAPDIKFKSESDYNIFIKEKLLPAIKATSKGESLSKLKELLEVFRGNNDLDGAYSNLLAYEQSLGSGGLMQIKATAGLTEGQIYNIIADGIKEKKRRSPRGLTNTTHVSDLFIKMGYDGVLHITKGNFTHPSGFLQKKGEKHYVAFEPNQIKSAYNEGSFRQDFDNIYYRTAKRRENYDKLDWKEAESWLESRGIKSTLLMNGMQRIGNDIMHGYFHKGMVYITKHAEKGTEFHEAFHAVFRIWNDNKQQRSLLKQAEIEYGRPTLRELSKLQPLYPNLTEDQLKDIALEEKLAEAFRDYMITRNEAGIPTQILNFFKDIIAYIRSYLSNKRTIDQVFRQIASGNINKQFTRSFEHLTEDKLYHITSDFSPDEARQIVSGINNFVVDIVEKHGITDGNQIYEIIRQNIAAADTPMNKKILENWTTEKDPEFKNIIKEGFVDKSRKMLANWGYSVRVEEGEDKIYDLASIEQSREHSMSGEVKNFFSRIKTGNPSPISLPTANGGVAQISAYQEPKQAMRDFLAATVDSRSLTEMLSRLRVAAHNKPYMNNMVADIENLVKANNWTLIHQIYSQAASLVEHPFIGIVKEDTWYEDKDGNKKVDTKVNVINMNDTGKEKFLLNKWKAGSRETLYVLDAFGNTIVNPKALKDMGNALAVMDTVTSPTTELTDDHYEAIDMFLAHLGANLQVHGGVKAIMDNGVYIDGKMYDGATLYRYMTGAAESTLHGGVSLRQIHSTIESNASKGKVFDVYAHESSTIKRLVNVVKDFETSKHGSYIGMDNKSYYPINMQTTLTRQINALAKYDKNRTDFWNQWVKDFAEDEWHMIAGKKELSSPLIYGLLNKPSFRRNFGYGYFDGIKVSDDNEPVTYKTSMPQDSLASRLHAFVNGVSKETMYIAYPTLADRSNMLFVKMPREFLTKTIKGKLHHDPIAVDQILEAYVVQDIRKAQRESKYTGPKIKNYHTKEQYKYFSQLPFLNFSSNAKELMKVSLGPQGTTKEEKDAIRKIKKQLLADVKIEIKNNLAMQFTQLKYDVNVAGLKASDFNLGHFASYDDFLMQYVAATLIGQQEIRKLTTGDTAFAKNSDRSGETFQTAEAHSKRTGGIMTPGLESVSHEMAQELAEIMSELEDTIQLPVADEDEFGMAIMGDLFSSEESYNYMKSLVDNNLIEGSFFNTFYGKGKSNKTDAMGYTTLEKHRAKLDGMGMWKPVHEQAYQNYLKTKAETGIGVFKTPDGIRPKLNPLKTYHDGSYLYTDSNGVSRKVRVLIKHSTFPLLDEFCQVSPKFKVLQEWMYENDIGETNMDSGVKIGAMNINDATITPAKMFKGFWKRAEVAKDTDHVYLFGDNTNDRVTTKYVPKSTQAVIRGLDNAIGIDTKKNRGTAPSSYFTNADFAKFKKQVDEAIAAAKATGKRIVIPADGIGTGKAMLKEKAPKLFEYLQEQLDALQWKPYPIKLSTRLQRVPQTIPTKTKEAKLGSQIMKLIIANMQNEFESGQEKSYFIADDEGGNPKEVKSKELFDKYQEAVQQLLEKNKKQLWHELGYHKVLKNPNDYNAQKTFYKNLRDLLIAQASGNRGLADNYLKALGISGDGNNVDFTIPLSMPIFQRRFQSLLFGIFRNRLMRIPVNGGAMVQIAEFGESATHGALKFVGAKDGKVAHAEVAIPYEMAKKLGIPSTEDPKELAKIPEKLRTIVGYRIPTQGKNSMLPLKIVRILPPEMGKTILVPGEITSQMGSDFDVDKLFFLSRNWDIKMRDGETAQSLLKKELEKVGYTFDDAIIQKLWNEPAYIEETTFYINSPRKKSIRKNIDKAFKKVNDTIKEAKLDPSNARPKKYKWDDVAKSSRAGVENMLIDIMEAMLTAPHNVNEMLSPIDSDTLPDMAKLSKKLNPGLNKMLMTSDITSEIELQFRNKDGKDGIGISAVNLTGLAMAQYAGYYQLNDSHAIRMNNEVMSDLTVQEDKTGQLLTYAFSKHMTIAVDNANDPVMFFINDNPFTANVTTAIIRSGIGLKRVGEKLAKRFEAEGLGETESLVGGADEIAAVIRMQPIIMELNKAHLANPRMGMKALVNKIGKKFFGKGFSLASKTTNLDIEALVDQIGGDIKDHKDSQLEVLRNFYLYDEAGRQISADNKVFNADRISDMSTVEAIEEFLDVKRQVMYRNTITDGARNVFERGQYPISQAFNDNIDLILKFTSDNNLFPFVSEGMQYLKEQFRQALGKEKLKREDYKVINEELFRYTFSRPDSPFRKVFERAGQRLVKGDNNISEQLLRIKRKMNNPDSDPAIRDLMYNEFLNRLFPHPDNYKTINTKEGPVDRYNEKVLKFDYSHTMDEFDLNNLGEQFNDLLNFDPNIDPEIGKFARNLVYYSIRAKGFSPGIDNFIDLIPIEVWSDPSFDLSDREDKMSMIDYWKNNALPLLNHPNHLFDAVSKIIENNSHRLSVQKTGAGDFIESENEAEQGKAFKIGAEMLNIPEGDGFPKYLLKWSKKDRDHLLYLLFDQGINDALYIAIPKRGTPYKDVDYVYDENITAFNDGLIEEAKKDC